MKRVITGRIRRSRAGLQVAADVNAVVVSGRGGTASVRQHVRIVQRDGRTEVDEVDVDPETSPP